MIQVVFQNLKPSGFVKSAALERIESVVDRFPLLQNSQLILTLSMENSPHHPGLDHFTVKFHCKSGAYRGVTIRKANSNLYLALADLVDHLQEALNRKGDRRRVSERRRERQWSSWRKSALDQVS